MEASPTSRREKRKEGDEIGGRRRGKGGRSGPSSPEEPREEAETHEGAKEAGSAARSGTTSPDQVRCGRSARLAHRHRGLNARSPRQKSSNRQPRGEAPPAADLDAGADQSFLWHLHRPSVSASTTSLVSKTTQLLGVNLSARGRREYMQRERAIQHSIGVEKKTGYEGEF